ncbi:unnamed protein product [[Actinomadura] parvosata subsp. kistnae]|uniref:DUF3040 domain-containing protein n=1 Tax=[Actinomadura] parvosata subsp. kistnae TaxID=1909395 RepID=A0A1U9ZVH5_9ACTN|nr:DUF3040 domain-containing protein [Nonomuraea sp. ATCC 55076]AQZ61940.1 hypothetical protein BKM31_11065 [Nonomuraea sp. ATCC 55076]SPL99908.1 unnamed protein product [Actinomadura parvosata subsp. kistnae]
MGLSRAERRALAELERRLIQEEPELDAMLSGSPHDEDAMLSGPPYDEDTMLSGPPHDEDFVPSGETEPLPVTAGGRSLLHVWCMLVMLTCAVLMIGIVLLIAGERSCTGLRSTSCQSPAGTQAG